MISTQTTHPEWSTHSSPVATNFYAFQGGVTFNGTHPVNKRCASMLVFLLLRKLCEFVIMGGHKDVDSWSYIGGIRMQAFPHIPA